MKRALVTGSNGFIGSHLVKSLLSSGWCVRATTRKPDNLLAAQTDNDKKLIDSSLEEIVTGDISSYSGWENILENVDVVVHLAGLAHDTRQKKSWASEDYLKVNVEATKKIARAAANAGVRRFIFISSIKVNGEETSADSSFNELSPPDPRGDYSVSKHEAEQALKEIAKETGLEVVIIRPVLVYGANVKGNMGELVAQVSKRDLIPVPGNDFTRSFVYVGNLVDAIKCSMEHPEAAGETFVVSDGEDSSTTGLIRMIASAMDRKVTIIPIPKTFLFIAGLAGDIAGTLLRRRVTLNSEAIRKIQSSLRVDSSKIGEKLGWSPPYKLEKGIKEMVLPVKGGGTFVNWLRLYDLLSVPVAWVLAMVVRYDYFVVAGGFGALVFIIPIVMVAQYLVYWLIGFNRGHSRTFRFEDILRVALLGVMSIGLSLFIFSRLEGISRTTLVLYPIALAVLLSLPKLFFKGKGAIQETETTSYQSPPEAEGVFMYDTRVEAPSSRESYQYQSATPPINRWTTAKPKVSVIIVNYNASELLTECVSSALKSTIPVEVIVSDNGSTDGSLHYLRKMIGDDPHLLIVENNANLGFAKANNHVLPHARGEHMLFLNPDCIIEPDTIEQMAKIVDSNQEVGMAGCLIKNLDGSEQAGCRRMVPTPWRTFVRILYLDRLFPNNLKFKSFLLASHPLPSDNVYVEALSGAFMYVRASALNQVGPLDDKYFMHCEDLDWCMRFRAAGFKILFAPKVAITHIKGTCSRERPIRVLWHKHHGMVRFYRKFFKNQYPMIFMSLVTATVWLRFATITVLFILKRSFRKIDDDTFT